jgi:hypothetical protein
VQSRGGTVYTVSPMWVFARLRQLRYQAKHSGLPRGQD